MAFNLDFKIFWQESKAIIKIIELLKFKDALESLKFVSPGMNHSCQRFSYQQSLQS